jgi:hypothetical protein
MGNNKSVITNFTLVTVNYKKSKLEKISNCENEKDCPLDIIFDSQEDFDKIKLFKNNDKPFEIYGLNRVLISHNYVNLVDHNGDSKYMNYIQEKINTQKKDFFIITWKTYFSKKDYMKFFSNSQSKNYSVNIYNFNGKELKTFFIGMGSIASMKISDESKKYTFLPTNMLVLKYNKFAIYSDESDLIYTSSYKFNFEFEKHKYYSVVHFSEIKYNIYFSLKK